MSKKRSDSACETAVINILISIDRVDPRCNPAFEIVYWDIRSVTHVFQVLEVADPETSSLWYDDHVKCMDKRPNHKRIEWAGRQK